MNVRSTVAVLAALGSMAAGGAWMTHRPMQGMQAMKWTATLESMNGSTVKGTASLAPGSSATSSVAMISITGGTAGATYPWHIHMGKCPAGSVFGGGSSYKPIAAGSDGSGKSTANLPVASPASGDYHVNVHASSTDMKTIVACGDLTMAGM
jgi:Cu-Zn family superoxide dismutase